MRSPLRSHKKTGPKPTFTADEAIDAVFDIGLDRFTLGQVAEKLGVATSALYRLFKSREDLMEACLARVSSEYPPPEGDSADALLRDYANKVWELMDTHPGLDLLFVQFSATSRFIAPHLNALINAFEDIAGWDVEIGLLAVDTVTNIIMATHAAAASFNNVKDDADIAQPTRGNIVLFSRLKWRDRANLDTKLDFLIPAFAAEAERRAQESGTTTRG